MPQSAHIIFGSAKIISMLSFVTLAGCSLEATFPLSRTSEMPQVWRDDPRIKSNQSYEIRYSCYTDGDVVAHISPLPHDWTFELFFDNGIGCFTVTGKTFDCNSDRKSGERLTCWFSFHGIAERYEFLNKDQLDVEGEGVSLRLLSGK